MNITQKLSFTSIVMVSVFATGCSQQQIQQAPEPTPVVVQPEPVVEQAAPVMQQPAPVVVKPAPRRSPNCHTHPANSMTKSIQHCHPNPQGQHHYGKRTQVRQAAPAPAKPQVDVYALQRKLKAKGYYKGPIDGVVGDDTRNALQQFQNR